MTTESSDSHRSVEDALNSVMDSLNDPYFEADASGIITFVNRAYHQTLGYKNKQDVIGRSFARFTAPDTVRYVLERFGELYRTGKAPAPFEYHCRHKDGSLIFGEIVAAPIFNNGAVVGSRGIIRDISSHVAANRLLQQAKDSAEARTRELAAINRVVTAINKSLDLNEILQLVCRELASIFPVRNAGIALLSSDRTYLEVVAFHTPDPNEPSAIGLNLPFRGNKSSEQVIETKRTLVIQDAQQDSRTEAIADITRERGTQSLMLVPIISRDEAIGTIGMPARDPLHVFSETEIALAETLAGQIASAVDNAQLHAGTELALSAAKRDLEIGRQIQSGFFPEKLPDLPGWEIATRFHAARQVAGDFYDVYPLRNDDLTAFVIADVCDKGVGAALFMVLVRSLLRAFSEQPVHTETLDDDLLRIVLTTNNFIARYHGRSNMFATLVFAILDPINSVIHYVNAGHEPPIVLGRDGRVTQRLLPTGPAVGLFEDLEFRVEQLHLGPGECMVAFTDGTTDAKSTSGQPFSEERLLHSIAHEWTSVFSMLFELDQELGRHVGEQPRFDDITLLALRREVNIGKSSHAICRESRLNALPEIREFVEAAAEIERLDEDEKFAFKLCADEICTNIIEHGYEANETGLFSVNFEADESVARLVITDNGRHFPPDHAEKPNVAEELDKRSAGGLGIHFVRELMDEVSYTRTPDNGNRMVMIKRRGNT